MKFTTTAYFSLTFLSVLAAEQINDIQLQNKHHDVVTSVAASASASEDHAHHSSEDHAHHASEDHVHLASGAASATAHSSEAQHSSAANHSSHSSNSNASVASTASATSAASTESQASSSKNEVGAHGVGAGIAALAGVALFL